LRETIDSVLAQTYDNWELCLAHGDVDDAAARAYLEGAAASDARIKVKLLDWNEGIAGNSNQALTLVTGEFLALLDHDDTLAPFALFETAQLLNDDPKAGFIYSDKDYLSELNFQRVHPLFKPEWSPDMMLNANYVTHLCIMRTEHVRAVGGWRVETDGAQDWDLFLRVIARDGHVRHIPKVLYHWRQIASSVAMSGLASKPYAPPAQVRTVQDYCRQVGLDVEVTYDPVGGPHVHWKNAASIKASIIFLSRNPSPESIANARRLRAFTSYPDFEVLLAVDDECLDSEIRCVRVSTPDLSERIVCLAAASSGQALVFVDEEVTPVAADWLEELVGPLQDSGIGMVGAKLLDAGTNCLRHAGIVFSDEGRPEYVFSGQPDHRSNEFGHASWYRDCSAVGGACFSISRQAWDAIGGLRNPARYPRLDVQIALDLKPRAGLRVVYNPYARLYQNGPAALEQNLWPEDDTARSYIQSIFPRGDPFLSPNLECRNGEVYVKRRHIDANALPRGSTEH
jgi:cellulose synthase/poly-beta-1,6-N-acetylglucosamine synthase-like glycosyltransferase